MTWTACDGTKQDKYVDGSYAGNRGCATVASASAAVSPYQNPGSGVCTVNEYITSSSPSALASVAREYKYGRFSFTQVDDIMVKMTAEACLAP